MKLQINTIICYDVRAHSLAPDSGVEAVVRRVTWVVEQTLFRLPVEIEPRKGISDQTLLSWRQVTKMAKPSCFQSTDR